MTVTGEQIYQTMAGTHAVKKRFTRALLDQIRPDILLLPQILADQLDQQVTLTGLFEAKIKLLRHILKQGSLNGIIGEQRAFMKYAFTKDPRTDEERAKGEFVDTLDTMAEVMEMMVNPDSDMPGGVPWLVQAAGGEKSALVHLKDGLDRGPRKLAENDDLTYGKLLELQPGLLLTVGVK